MYNYRDPTSWFFDPSRGYLQSYSALRQHEANTFINAVVESPVVEEPAVEESPPPKFCVGVVTVAREGARYFRTTVGSLLADLDPTSRAQIHLILFLAHTDPSQHPAYSEPWLHRVADRVLAGYEKVTAEELERIRKMEFREKGSFDYRVLLRECGKVGAEYVGMVEDDVVLMEGWFERVVRALEWVERNGRGEWLYLRLFYTEEFLGWNSEEWPQYLFWSLVWVVVPTICLLTLRYHHPPLRHPLSNQATAISCGLCIPLCILLFFSAGRVSLFPLPAGVNPMPEFGCCSQGLVFPQSKVQEIVNWYEERKIGLTDVMLEELAEKKQYISGRSLRHVGRRSSKGDDYGEAAKYHRTVAEKLWNFEFELNDKEALHRENSYLHP
ncbi:hypothetical protein FGG08_006581 [Glutinoglossum americanum]|uniref:Integral membrane protein n=1 Tax=Glutinoglossum americanum TaxID=1670608 RepID=A0A9P8I179_9PEZI|nr:hypothetical protein FGG08_006581 [Glutinoglossum americanum]